MIATIKQDWLNSVQETIKSSNEVRIISPFITNVLPPEELTSKNVTIITRFNLFNFLTGVSDLNYLEALVNSGVEIWGISNLHSKLFVFDDKQVISGSANFTNGGFRHNLEFGIITNEKHIITEAIDYFNYLKSLSSVKLTPELISIIKQRIQATHSNPEKEKSVNENFDSNVSLSIQLGRRYFMKIMGTSKDRGVITDSIAQYVSASNCDKWIAHSKRPLSILQDDVIYFARMMKGGDYRFYGRGRAFQFDSTLDTNLSLGRWPYQNRIIGAEFIHGNFDKSISFDEILTNMKFNQNMFFETTKRKHLSGHPIKNLRDVLKRAGYREISIEAASIIDQQFAQFRE